MTLGNHMISALWQRFGVAIALTLCVMALPASAAAVPQARRPRHHQPTVHVQHGVLRWHIHRQRAASRPHVARTRSTRATAGTEGIPAGRTIDPMPGDTEGFFFGRPVAAGVTRATLSSAGLSSEAPAGIQPSRAPPLHTT